METESITDDMPGETPAVVQNEILSIEVTTRCNSACGHCFVRAGRTKAVDLSPDLAAAIVSEGRGLGYRKLHITGGEPLLWEGLFGLIDVALTLGYESIFINSNGMLITDDIARRLAAYGDILSVSISIQGPEQHHNRVRGSGSYRIALAGLERALAAGLKMYIFSVIDRHLLTELPRL